MKITLGFGRGISIFFLVVGVGSRSLYAGDSFYLSKTDFSKLIKTDEPIRFEIEVAAGNARSGTVFTTRQKFNTARAVERQLTSIKDVRPVFSDTARKLDLRSNKGFANSLSVPNEFDKFYIVELNRSGLTYKKYVDTAKILIKNPNLMSVQAVMTPEPMANREDNDYFYWYLNMDRPNGDKMGGMNVRHAWDNGYTGKTVRVIAMEYTHAADTHSDIPSLFYNRDCQNKSIVYCQSRDHGTASLGAIGARKNGDETVGSAPESRIGFQSISLTASGATNMAEALIRAANQLGQGDIISASLGSGQDGKLLENRPTVCAAIKYAVSRGVLIVWAAGNSSMNVDSSATCGAGVIYVAADETGKDGAHHIGEQRGYAADFTNFGRIIDFHSVATLVHTTYPDNKYGYYNGTSAVAPTITGVIATFQDAARDILNRPLSSSEVKSILKKTGLKYRGSKPIGYWPDLKKAIDHLYTMEGAKKRGVIVVYPFGDGYEVLVQ